jgi:hypothetical protein
MTRPLTLLLIPLLAACNPAGLHTQGDQLILIDDLLFTGLGPDAGPYTGRYPVLQGTRVCFDPTPAGKNIERSSGVFTWSQFVTPDLDYLECFEVDWAGQELDGDGCFVADQRGTVQIDFEAVACAYSESPDFAPVDDFARFQVYAAEVLTARLEPAAERWAEVFLQPTPGTEWPTEDRPSPGGLIGLAAGSLVTFPVVLEQDPAGLPAAYRWGGVLDSQERVPESGRGYVRASTSAGALAQWSSPSEGLVALEIETDTEVELTLHAGGAQWPVVTIVSVEPEDAATIELVLGWNEYVPFAARALVRDADGMLIYGAPIEWEATGVLSVQPVEESGLWFFPGGDYTTFTLAEVEGPATFEESITARWGDRSAVLAVTIEIPAPPVPEPAVEEEVPSPFRCSCDAGAGGGSGAGLAFLFVGSVALAQRRKRPRRT